MAGNAERMKGRGRKKQKPLEQRIQNHVVTLDGNNDWVVQRVRAIIGNQGLNESQVTREMLVRAIDQAVKEDERRRQYPLRYFASTMARVLGRNNQNGQNRLR